MKKHEQIKVTRLNIVEIIGGWAMSCPVCGTYVASGSNCVPKPLFSTCNGVNETAFLPLKSRK